MSLTLEQLRDGALDGFNKLMGRSPQTWSDKVLQGANTFLGRAPPSSWAERLSGGYGAAISQAGFLFSLPFTVLSFLAIPFFGGTGTSINLVFFYLTWSALIWTHSPRAIEIYGTLAVRTLTFLLPSLAFLAFDYALPGASASIKTGGKRNLPIRLGQQRLITVAAWATFNVLLGVAVSISLEIFLTLLFGFKSTLRVTMAVPLPWTMAVELLKAFAVRGTLHYAIHRYILHAPRRSKLYTPAAAWHQKWAHSNKIIFSLAGAYDHPVSYLLAQWLPSYLPAVFWRMHVLTWLAFQVLVSLETLFVYSGYSALPSSIMLPGMARRVETHYATGGTGNFGHWGVLDFLCKTGCPGDSDIVEDLHDEADKHHVRRRVSDAVDDAGERVGKARERFLDRHKEGGDSDAVSDADTSAEVKKRRTRRARGD